MENTGITGGENTTTFRMALFIGNPCNADPFARQQNPFDHHNNITHLCLSVRNNRPVQYAVVQSGTICFDYSLEILTHLRLSVTA